MLFSDFRDSLDSSGKKCWKSTGRCLLDWEDNHIGEGRLKIRHILPPNEAPGGGDPPSPEPGTQDNPLSVVGWIAHLGGWRARQWRQRRRRRKGRTGLWIGVRGAVRKSSRRAKSMASWFTQTAIPLINYLLPLDVRQAQGGRWGCRRQSRSGEGNLASCWAKR